MAVMTFAAKLNEDGSFTIPQEAVETLGLHPGDEMQVRIETTNVGAPDQAELQRRSALLFEEADRLIREPGKAFTDPYEAAWAQGMEGRADDDNTN